MRRSARAGAAATTPTRQAGEALRGAGYEHYEVSNYARPGHRCAHNMAYWEGRAFYSFGLGSASYLQGRRYSRPKGMRAYREWVAGLAAAARVPLPVSALVAVGVGALGGGLLGPPRIALPLPKH